MPTYEYRCEQCGATVEVVQRFSDDPLTTCETCGGALRKVYAPVGIVFKGSGFYKTDSRGSSKRSSTPDAKPAAASSEPSGSSDGGGATPASKDPAPAAAPAAASSTAAPAAASS